MRRTLLGAFALALLLSSNALAATNVPVRIMIDGRSVERTPAISHNGRVFVELGGIVRAFSGLVVFDHATATVSIGSRVAVFTLGSARANLDGQTVPIGGKPFETDGDFYVPLAFVATRVARATVHLDAGGSVAMITSPPAPLPTPTPAPAAT